MTPANTTSCLKMLRMKKHKLRDCKQKLKKSKMRLRKRRRRRPESKRKKEYGWNRRLKRRIQRSQEKNDT